MAALVSKQFIPFASQEESLKKANLKLTVFSGKLTGLSFHSVLRSDLLCFTLGESVHKMAPRQTTRALDTVQNELHWLGLSAVQ